MATPPEKWEAVKALFEAALEEDSTRRSSFLEERCPDASLRAEVERLLTEHDQAGAFLSTPVLSNLPIKTEAPTQGLSEGELLAGRFRIIRFIAGGGMGEVYEAEDQELRERVAVKTIRPEILAQPNAVARFKREVHLARKVTHPNVCRIFDLFRHRPEGGSVQEETVFISMELLNGKSLGARLKEAGRMSEGEALPLVRQMASALAAAHAVGIVHRDFKPGNVVLVCTAGQEKVRPVVTDFGLALQSLISDEGVSLSLSTGQGLLGTPAYMSPEQIEGRPATTASDIYAFGLVIYEMVTGARPFQGDTPISAALKRLSEPPIPPRKFQPGLSPAWESVILRCLERDPAKRFLNAEAVARAISSEYPGVASGVASRKGAVRRMAAVLAVLLIAAIGIGYGVHRWRARVQPTAPRVMARRTVAVLGFKNLSGKPELAWISTALSEELTAELSAGEKLRTIPGENVARAKQDLSLPETDSLGGATLSRVHRMLGTDLVVLGSYLDVAQQLRVDLRVQDTVAGETIATISDTSSEDQILELVNRVGSSLRSKCGVGEIPTAEVGFVKASQPSNPDAVRLYADGLAKLRNFEAKSARELLEKAVAADHEFAQAHSALGAAWGQLGYTAKAQDESKKAFELAGKLSREQRLAIEGRYRSSTNDWEGAAQIYNTLLTFFPDNVDYGLESASAQTSGGKVKEALSTLNALRKLPLPSGDDPRIDLAQALAFESLGDLKQAQAWSDKALEKGRLRGSRQVEAQARLRQCVETDELGAFDLGELACEEAQRIYAESGDRRGLSRVLVLTGNLFADKGEMQRAAENYRKAIVNYREMGTKGDLAWALNNLGTILRERGSYAEAKKVHAEALELFRETGQNRGIGASLTNIAAILESEGHLEEARKSLMRSASIQRELGDKRRVGLVLGNLARVLFFQGRLSESQQVSQEAVSIERELGSKELTADALTHVAAAYTEQDKLAEARDKWQEAQEIYTSIGQKDRLAGAWVDLASLSIEEGRPGEADPLLRNAVAQSQSDKNVDQELIARALLAESLMARGQKDESRNEMEQALALSEKLESRTVRWEAAIRAARMDVPTAAEALDSLKRILTETRQHGYLYFEYEASLALGEAEIRSGRDTAGRFRLATLERDSRTKGFLLIARKASKARG